MAVQYPQFPLARPQATTPQMSSIINNAIPNFSGLTAGASGVVGNMLGGLPSTGPARNKAAYFGATSGLPNSGVSNALGYDLFNQEANDYRQGGFDNFLKLLQAGSGSLFPTTGQQIQSNQFNADQQFQQQEATRDYEQQANAANMARRRPGLNGLFRIPGQLGPVPGGSNLPWRRN